MEEQIIQSFLQNGYRAISAHTNDNSFTIITCINNGTVVRYFLKNIFNITDVENKRRTFHLTYKDHKVQVVNAYYKEHMPYLAFIYSYTNIGEHINKLIEPIGIQLTDRGLMRTEDMFFLSFDPIKIMEFVGLDAQKYNEGFQTNTQLNEWLSNHSIPKMPTKEINDFFN